MGPDIQGLGPAPVRQDFACVALAITAGAVLVMLV